MLGENWLWKRTSVTSTLTLWHVCPPQKNPCTRKVHTFPRRGPQRHRSSGESMEISTSCSSLYLWWGVQNSRPEITSRASIHCQQVLPSNTLFWPSVSLWGLWGSFFFILLSCSFMRVREAWEIFYINSFCVCAWHLMSSSSLQLGELSLCR